MKNIMKRFAADESGATAIEYGLIAAIMGVAVIGVFKLFGSKLTTGFTSIGDGFTSNAASVK